MVNEFFCTVDYFKIKSESKDEIETQRVSDGETVIFNKNLLNRSPNTYYSDKYQAEEYCSRTNLIKKFIESGMRPFTVEFVKLDGSKRTIRGTYVGQEQLMGRSLIRDLESTENNSYRLVDHRTINSLILDGTKYYVTNH